MIRVLLGSALSVLGIGAVASLGPTLLASPQGEPLVMMAPDQPTLQAASYDGDACNSTLIFADPADDANSAVHPGMRIVVFALPTDANDVAVAVEDFPSAPAAPQTVVLVFDAAGRLVSAGDPTSLQIEAAAALADCIEGPKPDARAPI